MATLHNAPPRAESNYLHLYVRVDRGIHLGFYKILVQSGRTPTFTKYVQRLRTILQRMLSKPGVPPKLAEMWNKAYSDLRRWRKLAPPVGAVSDVCVMVGCESVEAAQIRCARCGNALYCSKECQRS